MSFRQFDKGLGRCVPALSADDRHLGVEDRFADRSPVVDQRGCYPRPNTAPNKSRISFAAMRGVTPAAS